MSYKITNKQYLCVKFHESHKADAVKDFIGDIIANFTSDEKKRVMVDTRGAEVSDRVLSIGEVMKNFESLGVDKGVRIAVLRTPGAGKYHGFMKNIVQAEGYNFQLFDDFEVAVEWLTS